MNYDQVLNWSDMLPEESYQEETLRTAEARGKTIIDFLPRMYPRDEWILHKWRKWFERRSVPFVVTGPHRAPERNQPFKTLWKEEAHNVVTLKELRGRKREAA